MTSWLSILIVVAACLVGSFGPILIKKGMARLRIREQLRAGVPRLIITTITTVPLLAGVGVYGASMIAFIIALRGGELSVLYPIVATGYIWVSLWSVLFLRERMTLLKWTGIAFIIAGVSIIALA